ncbi:hypothetical protein MTO96_021413 [Rhipicephalus appendiculatus]
MKRADEVDKPFDVLAALGVRNDDLQAQYKFLEEFLERCVLIHFSGNFQSSFKRIWPVLADDVAEHSHRHKRQLSGLFSSVLDGVKNLVNTGTSIAGLGTGMLNLGGDEGIGGVVSGMLNLLSIGSEIFTGILGTLLNGDLLGGLLPFFGGQG